MEYKLIKGYRVSAGWVKHEVVLPGGVEDRVKYFDVRMGLTWPGNDNPAYACMVGEAWFDRQLYAADRGTMCLIWETEYDGLSINKFLDKVTDAFSAYHASVVYADLDQDEYKSSFYDYCDKWNLNMISLEQAPYSDDFYLGLSHLKDLDTTGDLSIPKNAKVFDEMRRIQRADLQDKPEVKFPRLNALRYVLGGFKKSPPVEKLRIGRQNIFLGDQGWMAR